MDTKTKKIELNAKTKKLILLLGTIGIVGTIIVAAVLGGWFRGREIQTLTITGSTTVYPIVQKAAEAYMDRHGNVDIRISGAGSTYGIRAIGEGTAEIGMSSREVRDEEITANPNIRGIVIASDAIAIIIHPTNPVVDLTLDQIRGIYNGTYTNWNEVGGSDETIVVINRDAPSGTRKSFSDYVMDDEDFVEGALEKPSNGAVRTTVTLTPGAIGYVGLGFVDPSVRAVKINYDGELIEPTVANALAGEYPISRPLYLLTNGEPQGLAKDFIDFILSVEGQKIVEDEGFVPVR